jgi:integrase/recombinase XerD
MTHTSQGISPLRQRMIDDMRMRKLAPKTQAGYVRVVRQFTAFLGRLPDTATVEDLPLEPRRLDRQHRVDKRHSYH